jgi:D-alanyl-D-alanine endopeptidase (penicillin-binding protein 7)
LPAAQAGKVAKLQPPASTRAPSKAKAQATPKAKPKANAKANPRANPTLRTARKPTTANRRGVAFTAGLPQVHAAAAVVIDAETGRDIYGRNADRQRPIASISKLAAALVVMDRGLDLDEVSVITKGDRDVARGGARSRLLEGMTLTNRDLLHAALMSSDNRAIPALGRAVKLNPSQLAAAMCDKARQLGLKNTHFRDPTGLSSDNVSTPRETVALLRAVMKHPVLGPIARRMEYDARPVGKPRITYVNTSRPAQRGSIEVLGGKTGYNDEARYCLVIATKVEGRSYLMSFLAAEGKLTRFGDVARVADWIIARKPKGTPPSAAETAMASAPPAAAPGPIPVGVAAPSTPSSHTAVP